MAGARRSARCSHHRIDEDQDLSANAESIGPLMARCRGAKAFLHCSSAAVYDPPNDLPRTERAALGDNHRFLFPTYSISKIEYVGRSPGRRHGSWRYPPPSPASTYRTATLAGGRTSTWR